MYLDTPFEELERFYSNVRTLIDMHIEDERKHYEENDKPSGHIYEVMLEMQDFLNPQPEDDDYLPRDNYESN